VQFGLAYAHYVLRYRPFISTSPQPSPSPDGSPDPQGRTFLRRKTLVQLVCVTGSLAGWCGCLGRRRWATIGSALARVGLAGVSILMLLSWIETVADGAALWVVMGQRLRLGFAVTVNAAGSMLNLILP